MTLENSYYKIASATAQEGATMFQIELMADCRVYAGHFPGNPVSPGACNMQMVKELAEKVAGQPLRMPSIKQCRMMAVVSPQATPFLTVTVSLIPSGQGFDSMATIAAADNVYLTFKGSFINAESK